MEYIQANKDIVEDRCVFCALLEEGDPDGDRIVRREPLVFVALGASFSAAGQFLLDYRDWIRRIGGALIVIFGLYIVGVLRIGFFGRSQQWQLREKPAGYLGSLAVGITFAIGSVLGALAGIWSRCISVRSIRPWASWRS